MNQETEIALLKQEVAYLKSKQIADEQDIQKLKDESTAVHKLVNRGAGAFVALAGLGLIIGWFLATGNSILSIWKRT